MDWTGFLRRFGLCRVALLFEGDVYCDEPPSGAGQVTSTLGLFVFRNLFASTVVRWDGSGSPYSLQVNGKDARYPRFSPDGRYLFARSEDETHRWYRWDASNLQASPLPLSGSDEGYELVFDPSSRYLAIPQKDGVRIYDVEHIDKVQLIAGSSMTVQWVP